MAKSQNAMLHLKSSNFLLRQLRASTLHFKFIITINNVPIAISCVHLIVKVFQVDSLQTIVVQSIQCKSNERRMAYANKNEYLNGSSRRKYVLFASLSFIKKKKLLAQTAGLIDGLLKSTGLSKYSISPN